MQLQQEIKEQRFRPELTPQYELWLILGLKSICMGVIDEAKNVLLVKYFPSNIQPSDYSPITKMRAFLRDTFSDEPLLGATYRLTKIAFATPLTTLVPAKMYDAAQKKTYLEKNTALLADDEVLVNPMTEMGFYHVFGMDKPLLEWVQSVFPNGIIAHSNTALLLAFGRVAEEKPNTLQIFANIRDGQLQIALFEGKNLMFQNTFVFQTSQDLIYYFMLVYEQFKLDPEKVPARLAGELTIFSEGYKVIVRYIRNVEFMPFLYPLQYGQQWQNTPLHTYFDLFSLTCL